MLYTVTFMENDLTEFPNAGLSHQVAVLYTSIHCIAYLFGYSRYSSPLFQQLNYETNTLLTRPDFHQ